MTKNILAKDPVAQTFFRCKPLNNLVLIKDTDPQSRDSSIGTKIYVPFNENDIYEGGRTVFVHDRNVRQALVDNFGQGALPKEILDMDMKILRILDRLPSMDPFLLKDIFINEGIDMNPAYFEVAKELWDEIENYILQGFEPLAKAAFPDALSSGEVARKLIEKIWEGRDLEALQPLITAFRLPKGQEMEIFAAWKGIIFYGFEQQRTQPLMAEMMEWIKEIKIPIAVITGSEREEFKAMLEKVKSRIQDDWKDVNQLLNQYQMAYDKMFKLRQGSTDFLNFLKNSTKAYWTLGNGLAKIGHAAYCWNVMTKRYPGRKMPWDQTFEFVILASKIFSSDRRLPTAVNW